MIMVTTNEKDTDQPLEVNRAIAELRQAIVASVLRRKHGFNDAGELAGIGMNVSESLDDYAARLLAGYHKSDNKTPPLTRPVGDRTQEGRLSSVGKSIWRRVVRFFTFGTNR